MAATTVRLSFRLNALDMDRIEQAAALRGVTVSDFAVDLCCARPARPWQPKLLSLCPMRSRGASLQRWMSRSAQTTG